MKIGLYSRSIPCENKEKFNVATNLGADGLILDYDANKLHLLSTRNYYALQSLKTGLSIAAMTLEHFLTHPFFDKNDEQNTLKLIAEGIDVSKNMKIPLLLIPLTQASQITSEETLIESVRRLKFACTFAKSLGVVIGISDVNDDAIRSKLMGSVDHDNFVDITNGIDNWLMISDDFTSLDSLKKGIEKIK